MGFGQDLSESQVCFTALDSGQQIGLSIIIVVSSLSLFTVLLLLTFYIRNLVQSYRAPQPTWTIFNTDIDAYFLSLLFSDILVSVGGIMNLKWVIQGHSSCGGYCTAQGVFQQIGAPAVALSSLAIAIHTFFVIFYKWAPPVSRVLGLTVVGLIWVFLVLLTVVGFAVHHGSGVHFYTPTPFWCWINQDLVAERLLAGYVYPWLSGLLSIFLYGLLYFRLRGNIVVSPDRWARMRLVWRPNREGERAIRYSFAGQASLAGSTAMNIENSAAVAQREARKMLWYPLCYTALILPVSIARWLSFRNSSSVPFAATVFSAAVFKLSGLIDVLLFMLTRPNLLLFGERRQRHRSSPPVSTPERPSRASDVHIQVEVRERPPTSATPILISSPIDAPTPETPDSVSTTTRDIFKPLTLDLPTPRISSIFQAWEDLQRVERLNELGHLGTASFERTSSRRTRSSTQSGRLSRLGFRTPLSRTPEPEPIPELPKRNSRVWTNVPNGTLSKNVARVSASFSVQTHYSAGASANARASTSMSSRPESVASPIAPLTTSTKSSRLPIGPKVIHGPRPRQSPPAEQKHQSHYIPASQALLNSRQPSRPKSQPYTPAHYLRSSQILSSSDSYRIPPQPVQQQQLNRLHQPRGPRPRTLTSPPSNYSYNSSSPHGTGPFPTRSVRPTRSKDAVSESGPESLTLTTSTSSLDARSRIVDDFPVPPPLSASPGQGSFVIVRSVPGTPSAPTRVSFASSGQGTPVPTRNSFRVQAEEDQRLRDGRNVEGGKPSSRSRRTAGADGSGNGAPDARVAEREPRRKDKGKQRADYVSFMEME